MPDLRSKALGYLRSGAVSVFDVRLTSTEKLVSAFVQGHAQKHVVDGVIPRNGDPERWSCSCGKHLELTCPHRAAVQLVTGGKTEARQ